MGRGGVTISQIPYLYGFGPGTTLDNNDGDMHVAVQHRGQFVEVHVPCWVVAEIGRGRAEGWVFVHAPSRWARPGLPFKTTRKQLCAPCIVEPREWVALVPRPAPLPFPPPLVHTWIGGDSGCEHEKEEKEE